MFQYSFQQFRQDQRVDGFVRRFTGRSPWVWLTVLFVGVLPFAVMALLLAIAAIVICSALYTVLGALDEIGRRIANALPGGAPSDSGGGRKNVRVVPPGDR